MNLTDIEFDHERMDEAVKHRKMGAGVTYEQDGVLFSSGFVAIKILDESERIRPPRDEYDDMSPAQLRAALRSKNRSSGSLVPRKFAAKKKVKKKVTKKDVRQRADDKLSGYKPEDQPDYVRQALSENHAAVMAEESAQ